MDGVARGDGDARRRPGVHLLPIYESARTYIPPPGPVFRAFFLAVLFRCRGKKGTRLSRGSRSFLFSGTLRCVAMREHAFRMRFPSFLSLERRKGGKEKRKDFPFLLATCIHTPVSQLRGCSFFSYMLVADEKELAGKASSPAHFFFSSYLQAGYFFFVQVASVNLTYGCFCYFSVIRLICVLIKIQQTLVAREIIEGEIEHKDA